MPVHFAESRKFDLSVPVVIIGGGACGLVAALAARDLGLEVLLVERDERLGGSSALSPGLIPAGGTRYQREAGIGDSPQQHAADIQRRSKGSGDVRMVLTLTRASGPTVEWLADRHGLQWAVVDGMLHPGHSTHRMHGVPERTGLGLVERLRTAAENAGVIMYAGASVADLYASEDGRVLGIAITHSRGEREEVGAETLVLACGGFAANEAFVRRFVPEMAAARYIGHSGSRGDALYWATLLGAGLRDLGAYQGHASLAHPQGPLLNWALMTEGGIKVNLRGERFANEHEGPSETAASVMNQPEGEAWDIYDERIHRAVLSEESYREAYRRGAIKLAASAEELAELIGVSPAGLVATLDQVRHCQRSRGYDPFGRDFTLKPPLVPPLYAVKVTAALFQAQGGIAVDVHARVLKPEGTPFSNLFAGGDAACGISGRHPRGYLAGNGLLAAVALGRLAGLGAARSILAASPRGRGSPAAARASRV